MPPKEREVCRRLLAEPEPERLARLKKQESVTPAILAVRDPAMIRLLAIAGAGGSY